METRSRSPFKRRALPDGDIDQISDMDLQGADGVPSRQVRAKRQAQVPIFNTSHVLADVHGQSQRLMDMVNRQNMVTVKLSKQLDQWQCDQRHTTTTADAMIHQIKDAVQEWHRQQEIAGSVLPYIDNRIHDPSTRISRLAKEDMQAGFRNRNSPSRWRGDCANLLQGNYHEEERYGVNALFLILTIEDVYEGVQINDRENAVGIGVIDSGASITDRWIDWLGNWRTTSVGKIWEPSRKRCQSVDDSTMQSTGSTALRAFLAASNSHGWPEIQLEIDIIAGPLPLLISYRSLRALKGILNVGTLIMSYDDHIIPLVTTDSGLIFTE